jgi:hypothetical protein
MLLADSSYGRFVFLEEDGAKHKIAESNDSCSPDSSYGRFVILEEDGAKHRIAESNKSCSPDSSYGRLVILQDVLGENQRDQAEHMRQHDTDFYQYHTTYERLLTMANESLTRELLLDRLPPRLFPVNDRWTSG